MGRFLIVVALEGIMTILFMNEDWLPILDSTFPRNKDQEIKDQSQIHDCLLPDLEGL